MENGKRKNIYIVIFIITTIIAGSLAVYFGIVANNKQQELDKQIAGTEELISKNNIETEKIDKEETSNEIKEKVITKYAFPEIDKSKCINKDDEVMYAESVSDEICGVSCYRNDDKKSVSIYFNSEEVKKCYNIDVGTLNSEINVKGFSNEIINIFCDNLGHQAVGGEVILFLMKDGTVEYLPIYNALKNKDIRSYGKIKGVSDVIRLGVGSFTNDEGVGYGGPIAIKSDGSFYNLSKILNDKVW